MGFRCYLYMRVSSKANILINDFDLIYPIMKFFHLFYPFVFLSNFQFSVVKVIGNSFGVFRYSFYSFVM